MHTTLTLSEPDPAAAAGLGPALFLLLEGDRPSAAGARIDLVGVEQVSLGRGPTRSVERCTLNGERHVQVTVPDPRMSGTHARLVKVLGRFVVEDAGSKNGTRVLGNLTPRHTLEDGDVLEVGRTFFLFRSAVARSKDLDASALADRLLGMKTLDPSLEERFDAALRVARSTVPFVLHGESGTGKELVARAVHATSGRAGQFVAVNCGALPENLLPSELFGHRKGAFSGATEDRPGLVRAAHRGTLFLDEIGDLPLAAQPAFLRVLQEGEVTPVGAVDPVKVDVRVVCATHRDLAAMVEAGTFRGDLLARLSGFVLALPPLRARRQDLGIVIADLIHSAGLDPAAVTLSAGAARAIATYELPLNARELDKALRSAVALADGTRIEAEHLPPSFLAEPRSAQPERSASGMVPTAPRATSSAPPRPLELSPRDVRQRDELVTLLQQHNGNVTRVAAVLGKARMQVQRWMKRFGIDPVSYRVD